MKNILLKLSPAKAAYALIALVAVLGIVGTVQAGSIFSWLRVEDKVAQHIAGKIEVPAMDEEQVGALSSPDIISPYLSVNGDTRYHIVQTFPDATTTIVAFENPFGLTATATVEMAKLDITSAATSSFSASCGAATSSIASPSVAIITATDFPTSSVGLVENNLTAALGGTVDGGTAAKITLTPTYPYFVCKITPTVSDAFILGTNTFGGKATVRVSQTR